MLFTTCGQCDYVLNR